jgi:hypothetical protein
MNLPARFPLSRASTVSTIVDEDYTESIDARATTRESTLGNESDSDADIDFHDFHHHGSVDSMLQQTRILLWIQCHETGRGSNKHICNCLRTVQGESEMAVQCFRSCRDIISKKNVSGDNSVHDYISTILSSK